MANAITSPGIVRVANEALVAIQPAINSIKLFAYDMTPEFASPGDTVKVPIAASGTLSAFDASTNNFENADGTITFVPVNLSSTVKSTFQFSTNDAWSAPIDSWYDTCAEAAAEGIRQYVSKEIGGCFLSTEITASTQLTSVTKTNIAKLRKQCLGRPDETVLILDPDTYAETIALYDYMVYGDRDPIKDGYIDRLYGFRGVLECRDMPDGVKGALVPKNAFAWATRSIRVVVPEQYAEYGVVTDPETSMSLTVMKHGALATGAGYLNVGCIFGFRFLQPAKCKLIV